MEPDTDYADEIIALANSWARGDTHDERFDSEVRTLLNELFHLGTQCGYEQGFDEGLKVWTS